MNDIEHQELLAEVASLYYEKDLNQAKIGDQLGLSRVKVYRLLKEAHDEQVVQISIMWPIERDTKLEAELARVFHLDNALVIKSGIMNYETALRRLGQMTARYLEATLKDGMTMAINLGQSTYEVINAIRPGFQANVNVAQAMGSVLLTNKDLDSSSLARQLAQKLGGQFYNLPSPIMANSIEAAVMLRDQPMIERAINMARHADITLVGIGGTDPEYSHYVKDNLIPAEKLIQMGADGVVGDISGKFITISGDLYDCIYNQCIIGVGLDDLKRIHNTIAVAMGQHKTLAILGALRTGAINTLCTDNRTANDLLHINE
jgi:DNA-binding transcriptional regulator LsrR (DeoR family)